MVSQSFSFYSTGIIFNAVSSELLDFSHSLVVRFLTIYRVLLGFSQSATFTGGLAMQGSQNAKQRRAINKIFTSLTILIIKYLILQA